MNDILKSNKFSAIKLNVVTMWQHEMAIKGTLLLHIFCASVTVHFQAALRFWNWLCNLISRYFTKFQLGQRKTASLDRIRKYFKSSTLAATMGFFVHDRCLWWEWGNIQKYLKNSPVHFELLECFRISFFAVQNKKWTETLLWSLMYPKFWLTSKLNYSYSLRFWFLNLASKL